MTDLTEGQLGSNSERHPPLSKAAYVLQRLREDFSAGLVSPGEPLRQEEIALRYGVSATPVREALRILEADGLIVYAPHRGATVAQLPAPDVRDLYLLRANVEALTASLAVERGSDAQIRDLRRQHEDLAQQVDELSPEDLSRRNRDLHLAIMTVGSPFIAAQVIRPLWRRTIPASASMWATPDIARSFIAEHEEIIIAIENRQAAEASNRMANHINHAGLMRQVWKQS